MQSACACSRACTAAAARSRIWRPSTGKRGKPCIVLRRDQDDEPFNLCHLLSAQNGQILRIRDEMIDALGGEGILYEPVEQMLHCMGTS